MTKNRIVVVLEGRGWESGYLSGTTHYSVYYSLLQAPKDSCSSYVQNIVTLSQSAPPNPCPRFSNDYSINSNPKSYLSYQIKSLKFLYPVLWPPHVTHWKRLWCWEGLRAGGKGDDRGWDGWMASPTRWTWVWVNSGCWWRTGRPGVLWCMGSQRVGHDWATELNWNHWNQVSGRLWVGSILGQSFSPSVES